MKRSEKTPLSSPEPVDLTARPGGRAVAATIRGAAASFGLGLALLCVAAAGVYPAAAVAPRAGTARSITAENAAEFVNAAYHDLVSHGPSATAKSYWTARLVSGATTRPELVTYLITSAAAARTQLILLYEGILNRAPSDAALASWTSEVTSHRTSLDAVAQAFYASDEFYLNSAAGSTSQWVRQLYAHIYGISNPTDAQVARWVTLVGSQGRAVTAAEFYESGGPRARRVVIIYRRMLRRAPSGAALTHWADVERAGDQAVEVPLAESTEYLDVAQTRGDPRVLSPLALTAHLGVWVDTLISPQYYLTDSAMQAWGLPPGLHFYGATPQVFGTPTTAGTFHTYLTIDDQSPTAEDIVVDTLTVTVLP